MYHFFTSGVIVGLTGLSARPGWGIELCWGLCCLLLLECLEVDVVEGDERAGATQSPMKSEILCLIMPGTSALLQLIESDAWNVLV